MGDTILDGIDYKKLYITQDTTLTNWGYYGGIRETNDKVYLFNNDDDSATILYDFSLSPGDMFTTYYNGNSNCQVFLELQSIDTITILNGEQRRRFNFGSESWIEGIGSLHGLIYVGVFWCEIDLYFDLSCCFLNDEQIYQSYAESCIVYTVGINENETETTHSLFPNPFSNSCILKFNYIDSQEYKLQIINQNAQIIETIENIKSGEIEIRKGKMNKGLYYYRLQTEKGIIASGMMIVN